MVEMIFVAWFAATLRMATPVLFSATGELFSELSGILNVGLESMMLVGAFTGFIVAYYFQNVWLGILAGMAGGACIGLMMGILSVSLGANQILAGVALNIFGIGITSFLYRLFFGIMIERPSSPPIDLLKIPLLSEIPVIGPIFFEQMAFGYVCFLLVPIAWFLLYRTEWGLRVRMVGEKPLAADSLGISISGTRYMCVLITGVLAGLGGVTISLGRMHMFFENMTAERGMVAIAAVIYGKWRPLRMVGATLIFGMAEALQLRVQASGIGIPAEFLSMLPYLLVIFALVYSKGIVLPEALCVPYSKEGT